MSTDLKKSWERTAKSFVIAANDLGRSIFDTAKAGYDATMEWANSRDEDGECVNTEGAEVPETDEESPAEEAPAEEAVTEE